MPFDDAGLWFAPETVNPAELSRPHPPTYRYRDPVPRYVRRTPGQLLEAYYRGPKDDGQSEYQDPGGMSRMQLVTVIEHPKRAAAPIGSLGLIGRWPRPGDLQVVPVPIGIPGGEPMCGIAKIEVEFRSRGLDTPSRGILLRVLGSNTPSLIEDGGEIVLGKDKVPSPWKDVVLIIAWPGYKPKRYLIRAATSNELLTRGSLGMRVAVAYAIYFKKVEVEGRLPDRPGFFNIALHQGKNSRQDSPGIQFTQLHLVRFRNTVGGFWAADIEIV